MTTRFFTYEAKTGEVIEYDDAREYGRSMKHPLGDDGAWGGCPGVAVGADPDSLCAGIVQAIDDLKKLDGLAVGSIVHVTAYCQHVRYGVARERGWLTPMVREKFVEHPDGWLLVAMIPSLRIAGRR